MQLDIPNILGLTGASIAGIAYLPQIIHLVKEHCSAGISIGAYVLWFIASILVTFNAFWIESAVFIALGLVQIIATALICVFSMRYKGQTCPSHTPAAARS